MKKFLQLIAVGCILSASVFVQASEGKTKTTFSLEQCPDCQPGGQYRDTCERCAKVTKNSDAFPLCCENKSGARDWCNNFLNYVPKF